MIQVEVKSIPTAIPQGFSDSFAYMRGAERASIEIEARAYRGHEWEDRIDAVFAFHTDAYAQGYVNQLILAGVL